MNLLLCERRSRTRVCVGHGGVGGLRRLGSGCRTAQAKLPLRPWEREDIKGSLAFAGEFWWGKRVVSASLSPGPSVSIGERWAQGLPRNMTGSRGDPNL